MLKRIILGLFLALCTVAFFNIPSALSIPSLQERKDAKVSNVPHWKTSTITVYIPKNQRAASMRRAFQQWQAVSAGHLNFKFVQSGPANIDVVFVPNRPTIASPIPVAVITDANEPPAPVIKSTTPALLSASPADFSIPFFPRYGRLTK